MSQRFNNYNGNPDPRMDNTFGELTNSLIFPGSLPFQPAFQPAWPIPPGWQMNGQNNYPLGNFYEGQLIGSNGYFPEQQDYAAFDEGDDFYADDDEDISMGQDLQGQANQAGATSRSTPSIQHGAKHKSTTISGTATPSSRLPEQQQAKSHTSKDIIAEDPAVKLAALRARLMIKKDGAGKTPTPEPRANRANGNIGTGKSDSESRVDSKPSGEDVNLSTVRKPPPDVTMPKISGTQRDVKSTVDPQGPSLQQQASGTDIEALFDEARAVEAAKKSKLAAEETPEEKIGHTSNKGNVTQVKSDITPSASGTLETSAKSRRQSMNSGRASSSTSEQGEIREEPNKLDRSRGNVPLEPKSLIEANGAKEKPKPEVQENIAQPWIKSTSIKQQPPKIDTSIANTGKGGSGLNSANPSSPISAKGPAPLKTKGVRDLLASTDSKDEFERYREPLEYAYERPSERRVQRDYDRDRSNETYSQHNVLRPQHKYRADEAEQAAAEYKKQLQKVGPEPRDTPQVAEEAQATQKAENVESFEDVNTWLEMTGYFDEAYRTKALARHRKLVELDKQRAELEREEQIEHEERLHIARAQSVRPRESIEGPSLRINVAPQGFPSFSMPPPPLPMKETQEDVGMQIKDLAIRDAATAAKRTEDDLRASKQLQSSPTVLTPAVKRRYSEEDYDSPTARPIGKIARTDSRDYSFDKRQQQSPKSARVAPPSLESRISVDNGSYRPYQARSKSPDSRRRSLSPYRRASGSDMQLVRQHSGSSRNGYSPLRRPGMSRDTSPSRRDGGISYDDAYDSGTRGRYNAYRFDHDKRSNSGYDSYTTNNQRGHYQNQHYQSTGYRARGTRGRGRGHHSNNNNNHPRGGSYKPYDRGSSE